LQKLATRISNKQQQHIVFIGTLRLHFEHANCSIFLFDSQTQLSPHLCSEFIFPGEFGGFFRIPVPLYLQHLEAVTLLFTWYLHDFAVLMLVGYGMGGVGRLGVGRCGGYGVKGGGGGGVRGF